MEPTIQPHTFAFADHYLEFSGPDYQSVCVKREGTGDHVASFAIPTGTNRRGLMIIHAGSNIIIEEDVSYGSGAHYPRIIIEFGTKEYAKFQKTSVSGLIIGVGDVRFRATDPTNQPRDYAVAYSGGKIILTKDDQLYLYPDNQPVLRDTNKDSEL